MRSLQCVWQFSQEFYERLLLFQQRAERYIQEMCRIWHLLCQICSTLLNIKMSPCLERLNLHRLEEDEDGRTTFLCSLHPVINQTNHHWQSSADSWRYTFNSLLCILWMDQFFFQVWTELELPIIKNCNGKTTNRLWRAWQNNGTTLCIFGQSSQH